MELHPNPGRAPKRQIKTSVTRSAEPPWPTPCIEPAPERGKKMTWAGFLRAHWSVLAAADFFTVEVWGLRGLVTIYVFFVMEIATRRIEIA